MIKKIKKKMMKFKKKVEEDLVVLFFLFEQSTDFRIDIS